MLSSGEGIGVWTERAKRMGNRSKRHMGDVAQLGCILCDHLGLGKSPAEVHHIGDSAERSDWLVIPLCPLHHRGKTGFHGMGERKFNATYKTSEIALLAMTLEALAK